MAVWLEFFRPDHGHEQVDEQQQGHEARDEVFHDGFLQFVAATDVKRADHEEESDQSDVKKIRHRFGLLGDSGVGEAERIRRATTQGINRAAVLSTPPAN
jgi:hypothetical protein